MFISFYYIRQEILRFVVFVGVCVCVCSCVRLLTCVGPNTSKTGRDSVTMELQYEVTYYEESNDR